VYWSVLECIGVYWSVLECIWSVLAAMYSPTESVLGPVHSSASIIILHNTSNIVSAPKLKVFRIFSYAPSSLFSLAYLAAPSGGSRTLLP